MEKEFDINLIESMENEVDEIKTFNTVMSKDETLQNYLKEIGKIKLLNKKAKFC